MENKSVKDVIELVEKFDGFLSGEGFKRDNSIKISYKHKKYRASLTVFKDDEEEEDYD